MRKKERFREDLVLQVRTISPNDCPSPYHNVLMSMLRLTLGRADKHQRLKVAIVIALDTFRADKKYSMLYHNISLILFSFSLLNVHDEIPVAGFDVSNEARANEAYLFDI